MKESTQTLLFIAVALGSVLIATQSRPTDATYEVSELIGKPLFDAFEPEQAMALRIVEFNEETATLRDFEVAEEDGVWSIPSKGGYPADAESQMAEASTGVIDLEILTIATKSAEDHTEYGVVEPSSDLDVGSTGVGTRVTLTDQASESLVDVVIGKEVKGAEDQRYVRRTSQDVVFTVAIDPSKFSTKFEDWIEDDLLDLEAWDIARVQVKDYTAELVMQGFRPAIAFDPRADLTLDFDDGESAWRPGELKQYNKEAEAYEDFELTPEQELNEETLNELKTAVGDLKIVDVERKPGGLSADLKAGEDFFGNRSAVSSLMERGFAPTRGEGDSTDVLSSEGEVLIGTKAGVEYVLRFGKLQLSEEGGVDTAKADEEGDEASSGVNRYLFVMAQVNEDLIEAPEIEVVPEEAAADASEEEGEAEDATDSRKEVEKRNQREQEAYEGKLTDAATRAAELNDRFGDWYYVISDEVYRKIAVGRDELISAKESDPADGDTPSAQAATPGPLGSIGGGIPGLPNVPGVNFNPAAAAETPTEDAEETTEAVGEAMQEAVEEAADTAAGVAEDTAEAAGEAAGNAVEAVNEAVGTE